MSWDEEYEAEDTAWWCYGPRLDCMNKTWAAKTKRRSLHWWIIKTKMCSVSCSVDKCLSCDQSWRWTGLYAWSISRADSIYSNWAWMCTCSRFQHIDEQIPKLYCKSSLCASHFPSVVYWAWYCGQADMQDHSFAGQCPTYAQGSFQSITKRSHCWEICRQWTRWIACKAYRSLRTRHCWPRSSSDGCHHGAWISSGEMHCNVCLDTSQLFRAYSMGWRIWFIYGKARHKNERPHHSLKRTTGQHYCWDVTQKLC